MTKRSRSWTVGERIIPVLRSIEYYHREALFCCELWHDGSIERHLVCPHPGWDLCAVPVISSEPVNRPWVFFLTLRLWKLSFNVGFGAFHENTGPPTSGTDLLSALWVVWFCICAAHLRKWWFLGEQSWDLKIEYWKQAKRFSWKPWDTRRGLSQPEDTQSDGPLFFLLILSTSAAHSPCVLLHLRSEDEAVLGCNQEGGLESETFPSVRRWRCAHFFPKVF